MNKKQFHLGLIGLGTMGRNLVLNLASHGYAIAGYDRSEEAVERLLIHGTNDDIWATSNLSEFIAALEEPRRVMLLVPAGKVVDSVIEELQPLLQSNDIMIDGGNSHFTDTARRQVDLASSGIKYVGMGISGGAEGARHGPSMMPSGDQGAWLAIKSMFESAAAQVNGSPCVAYLGKGAGGHYVKMVHNGIEYGLMQLIAETYDFMKRILKMSNRDIGTTFTSWNEGKLHSFLIEITGHIFQTEDPVQDGLVIDHILDQSKAKGTGKWTSQDAMDIQAPVPVIDLAVSMRDLSKYKADRSKASTILFGPHGEITAEKEDCLEELENALYFGFLITYAQGMFQLKLAAKEYNYQYHLGDVAAIWRGGCIIRSVILEQIMNAYQHNQNLSQLVLDPDISHQLKHQGAAREILIKAIQGGLPMPCLAAALSYYDAYRSEKLPANLIQAQRDYFGAHSFERIDKPGNFHADWYQD